MLCKVKLWASTDGLGALAVENTSVFTEDLAASHTEYPKPKELQSPRIEGLRAL